MSALKEIYKKIEANKFNEDCCFLCGTDLNITNKTLEHVIPRWAQSRYNLWDQKISLLNGTEINYRNLTIPCCSSCNNNFLQPIENKILKSIDKGVSAVRKLDRETVFYWLGKIYFGLMYKEMFLFEDQRNPKGGTILTSEYIKSFNAHYMFLQGIRKLHRFKEFFPASIYIVETQVPSKTEEQWDFLDNHLRMFISCRLGKVGIIAVLQDGGITKQLEEHLSEFFKVPLHPIQFRELSAKIFFKSTLINRTPKYISNDIGDRAETIQLPIMGLSNKPIFDDWDNDEYAKVLSLFTQSSLEFTNPEPGKVWTWMIDEEGNPNYIDVNNNKTRD